MKASINFREDQKPILRAKIPLNILGFPFRSGFEAGDSKELCLSFSTFFESGPLLKLCYRPNDSCRPFGFVVKTGIGHFGSPIGAPMTMSAEFNFLANGNTRFFLHFKPQIGDFSIRRSVNSQIALPSQPSQSSMSVSKIKSDVDSENEEFFENNETPVKIEGNRTSTGLLSGQGIRGLTAEKAVQRLLSGVEMCTRTSLPLRDRAVAQLRWGVKFPTDDKTAEISLRKIPYLVLSKIGIKHVAISKKEPERNLRGNGGDVAETCLSMKRDLDVLQVESHLLRKAIEEFRSEIGSPKSMLVAGARDLGRSSEFGRNGGKSLSGKKQNKESFGIANKGTDGGAAKPF